MNGGAGETRRMRREWMLKRKGYPRLDVSPFTQEYCSGGYGNQGCTRRESTDAPAPAGLRMCNEQAFNQVRTCLSSKYASLGLLHHERHRYHPCSWHSPKAHSFHLCLFS